jgi:hypothetical protein
VANAASECRFLPAGTAQLKAKALAALHRLQRLPHLVRGFFGDPNLRYVTA